jgi:hypothetical protein
MDESTNYIESNAMLYALEHDHREVYNWIKERVRDGRLSHLEVRTMMEAANLLGSAAETVLKHK